MLELGKFVINSGCHDNHSIHEQKRIRLLNISALMSGTLLSASVVWIYLLGVPFDLLKYFLPPIAALFLLFMVARYVSVTAAKYLLIILVNIILLLGGLVSDNTPRLQQVINTWIFSTIGILLVVFDVTEWKKIVAGVILVLISHLSVAPVDKWLDTGFVPLTLDNQIFVSVSFVFSMALLVGSVFYAQSTDTTLYKKLAVDLQNNNERLRAQEEELRQSYEELRSSREQIYHTLEIVNEKKSHLELALRIAKMGSYHYYFKDDRSVWSDELKNLMEIEGDARQAETFNMYDFIHPDDLPAVRAEVAMAKADMDEYSFIYRVFTRKNNFKIIHSAGFVFKDAYGNRLGIRGVIHDITDYKNIEQQLLESNRELETFIYRAYHDIKGPLATIKGICYVAALTSEEEISLHYFGLLKQHMFQLENILSKLLIINELKNMKPEMKPINIHKVLDEAALSLKNIDGFSTITLRRDIEVPEVIYSDKVFLKIIIQNLMENAIAFKNDQSPWLKVHVYEQQNFLVVEVSDNGIGIPEEFYNKIFERYFRVSEKSKGTGLGLYIVKKLTEKLNATLSVKSTPYTDTTFSLKIPVN